MGNLGKYQDIVEAAARAGGVDNWLKSIKVGAVVKSAPVLLAVGSAVGATAVALVGKYKATQSAAARDEEKLREALAEDEARSNPICTDGGQVSDTTPDCEEERSRSE